VLLFGFRGVVFIRAALQELTACEMTRKVI
jgi:hypothetical protein